MRFLVLIPCLLPALASAESINRCVDRAGQVSYQVAACSPAQRLDRSIQFVPDPVMPYVAPRSIRNPRFPAPARASRISNRSRAPTQSPCERAKAKRAIQLARLGLKRTFDDLSRIDAAVREVCNGY